jgi:hypothetical protein
MSLQDRMYRNGKSTRLSATFAARDGNSIGDQDEPRQYQSSSFSEMSTASGKTRGTSMYPV